MSERYTCPPGCGLCCRRLIVEISHLDVVREPRLLEYATLHKPPPYGSEDEWDQTYALVPRLIDGKIAPCGFLDDGKQCTIYPTRPNCCVGFEAGGEQCRELREQAGLPPLTPKPTETQ